MKNNFSSNQVKEKLDIFTPSASQLVHSEDVETTQNNAYGDVAISAPRDALAMARFSRLPMPAKLASLTDKIPEQLDRIRRRSGANSLHRLEQTQSLPDHLEGSPRLDKDCLSLTLTKLTGEFLGKYSYPEQSQQE